MRNIVLVIGVFGMVSTVNADEPKPNPEDARLTTFFQRYLDDLVARKPFEATLLGDHRADDRLEDLSPEARAKDIVHLRDVRKKLREEIRFANLSRSAQIDYEILDRSLERNLWLQENTDPFADDPRVYNPYISDSVFLLLTQSTLPKERNIRNAARRITYIPLVIKAAQAGIKNPPKELVETAIKQNRGAIDFYQRGIYEVAGVAPGLNELADPCKSAVAALIEYQKFLEEIVLPRATGNWRLGKEKFAKKLDLELDAGVTAEDVLRDAETEAERVEREMVVIARQLWHKTHPDKPLPPDDAAGRRDLVRRVLDVLSNDHGKPENLVDDARATVDRIKDFIRAKKILTLPTPDRCRIIEMPEFQRGFSVAYLNPAPPLDVQAISMYAVSPPPRDWDARRIESLLREYNRSMLQILTIHEAYPGHYVQLEYANRHPSMIRRVLSSGVYAEGWAVYTEQMMLDQGYGDGDLSLRMHQLKFYLRAVLNAILDHKMHCTDFSDADALKLLIERGFQSEGEAIGKISRAKQSSCQLSTYFVGRMAFYRLRQQVSRARGDRFDLGAFHEEVLQQGGLPVKYLPELVR